MLATIKCTYNILMFTPSISPIHSIKFYPLYEQLFTPASSSFPSSKTTNVAPPLQLKILFGHLDIDTLTCAKGCK